MDHNNYADNGHASLALCLITGFIAWVDAQSISEVLKVISIVVSIGAGIMAMRYYSKATKKIK